MYRLTILFLILLLFIPLLARDAQAGINFIIGTPQGEFCENIDRKGFGLGGHLAFHPNPELAIGIALGMLTYGSESRYEPFSTTIPDVTVEVTRSNNIALLHLMLQLGAPMGIVKPYAEGKVGINYLWTETTIKDVEGQEDVVSSTNFDDIAFSYGGGGGIMLRIWSAKHPKLKARKGKISKVYIDTKAIYTLGGRAEYLKEGSVIIHDDASVEYIVSESKTDLLNVHIGVVFEF